MNADIQQFEFINPLLRKIVLDTEKHFGFEFTITSLYRIGGNGVHSQLPLRGIDLRCRDEDAGKVIANYINAKWQYDPSRPVMFVCLLHDNGGGLHLHIQVHDKTRAK